MDSYLKYISQNKEISQKYYLSSLNKTYQQIFLESEILGKVIPKDFKPKVIADIACGAGTLTYHLSKIYPDSKFILIDYNPDAIELAKQINKDLKNAEFICEDFFKSSLKDESVDFVLSAQTISYISRPRKFIEKALSIVKNGGYFVFSSLFNLEHEVDLYCKVRDYTRKGRIAIVCNTISKYKISQWLKGKVKFFDIIPFEMPAPLEKTTSGIGSYTVELKDGRFLTISGGLLMQWGFLVGRK